MRAKSGSLSLLAVGLVLAAACGNRGGNGSQSSDGRGTDMAGGGMDMADGAAAGVGADGGGRAPDGGGDRAAQPADAGRPDVIVIGGNVCSKVCGNAYIRTCTGGASLQNCAGGCEYDRAANSECVEFDTLASCIIDARSNPYQCFEGKPRLKADVCVAEMRAFCMNPGCLLPPPTVPACVRP